jgi:hypothetical protein
LHVFSAPGSGNTSYSASACLEEAAFSCSIVSSSSSYYILVLHFQTFVRPNSHFPEASAVVLVFSHRSSRASKQIRNAFGDGVCLSQTIVFISITILVVISISTDYDVEIDRRIYALFT